MNMSLDAMNMQVPALWTTHPFPRSVPPPWARTVLPHHIFPEDWLTLAEHKTLLFQSFRGGLGIHKEEEGGALLFLRQVISVSPWNPRKRVGEGMEDSRQKSRGTSIG